jgi:hypothetical protein
LTFAILSTVEFASLLRVFVCIQPNMLEMRSTSAAWGVSFNVLESTHFTAFLQQLKPTYNLPATTFLPA